MAYKRNIDRLPIIPADAKEHNVVCHYCIVGCGYKAYSWDVNRQGGTAPDQNKFGVDSAPAAGGRDAGLVLALDVQHREPGRARRAPRRQARQGLRRQRRPGLDPRRADRRDVLLGRPEHAAAAAHHAGGLALRPDAADGLGRRARPGGPGHRGGRSRSRARTGCSSRPPTTAAPAAATSSPGAPASSTSAP